MTELLLKTTGGDCRKVVERSLGDFFTTLSLPRLFKWGDGDWSVLSGDALAKRDNRDEKQRDSVAEEAAHATPAPTPAPAPEPAPPTSDAEATAALAAALAALDPLLQALAAVPWLPETAEGAARRHFIVHNVLGDLRRDGWALDSAAAKIWGGAVDADEIAASELARGTDHASVLAARSIVFHTKQFREEMGEPPAWRASA